MKFVRRIQCFPLFLFAFISLISCNVTNRTKSEEVTTQTFVDNKHENEPKNTVDKGYNKVEEPDTHVYLDDVLFALNIQDWSEEENPCLKDINRLLQSLQNFTLWAVWADRKDVVLNFDNSATYNYTMAPTIAMNHSDDPSSILEEASEPQGLLFGNRYQLGNFDQCMMAPWSSTRPELKTKYCLAEIVLVRTDHSVRKKFDHPFNPYGSALDAMEYRPPHTRPLNELTWGACVPYSCQPKTVERLLAIMLARSHLGTTGMRPNISITENCQTYDDRIEFDGLFYGFVAFVAILVAISLLCTYLNNRGKKLDPNKLLSDIIKSFCIKENTEDLLKMKKDGIEILYGIRFLTICLIVLDHQVGIYNSGPISDGYTSDQATKTFLGLLILHDDLFVDTFFLLSGFLTITTLVRIKKFTNPLLIILKRYVRLIVALAVVVFYMSAVFPFTGTGPLWNRAKDKNTVTCRKNWWLNILMVSNYMDTENMCIVTSWYIPCDFHFFAVTVILYFLYKKSPQLGLLCGGVITVASIVIPGVVNYMYRLSAVQLFTYEFITDPLGSKDFQISYIKSHTRYAAYLVGFIAGGIYLTQSSKGIPNRISKKWAVLGSISALILMLVVMVSGSTFLFRHYHAIEGAIYAALNRPAWACSVAVLVLCCALGSVPFVKGFLSWYPWVPLSRLAYGLYLTHTIIITRNVFVTRNAQHNDYCEILNATAGVIFWGCLAALLLWLFAEAPANRLLLLCIKSRAKKAPESSQETLSSPNVASISTTPTGSGITGYLHDNLPNTIHIISSKM